MNNLYYILKPNKTSSSSIRGRGLEINTTMLFNRLNLFNLFVLLLFMLQLAVTPNAISEEKELPLWEIGLGVAPLSMPSYRGSRNQELYTIPMPYIDYRGAFLRADREGIRGLVYDSDRIRLDFSGDGAIASTTDKEGPRRGMPDLDPVLEFGPSINFIFYESPRTRIRLRMPLRAAVATDFSSVYHIGWKFHPDLSFDINELVLGWNVGAALGPIFADSKYHAFYYDVEERYATDFREQYRSGGGYSGTSLTITASQRFNNIWTGIFVRYDNLSGATFIDSPLVETRHSFMAGLGVAYIFRTSKRTVPAGRDDF